MEKNRSIKSNNEFSEVLLHFSKEIEITFQKRVVRKFLMRLGLLILALFTLFYLTQEIFGWMTRYLFDYVSTIFFLSFIPNLYLRTRIKIPFFLRGNISFNFLLVGIVWLLLLLYLFAIYYVIFQFKKNLTKIYSIVLKILKKSIKVIDKITSFKLFPILYFTILIYLIFIVDQRLAVIEENIALRVIVLAVSYSIFAFQTYLFIRSVKYYEALNHRQNYFLIGMISCFSIILITFVTGSFYIAVYILHTKFITYLIFFNLLIIQNTYFLEINIKKKKVLFVFIIIYVLLGVFYSLRLLSFG